MKEYYCEKSKTKKCKHAGNKRFNFGFVSGLANYCRYSKRFIRDIDKCDLKTN